MQYIGKDKDHHLLFVVYGDLKGQFNKDDEHLYHIVHDSRTDVDLKHNITERDKLLINNALDRIIQRYIVNLNH